MYKFQTENRLIENMYLLITLLLKYDILPIFVFDGQPPPEKKELIKQRALLKREAELKYNELQQSADSTEVNTTEELANLKKQFVRIHDTDIANVKLLFEACSIIVSVISPLFSLNSRILSLYNFS